MGTDSDKTSAFGKERGARGDIHVDVEYPPKRPSNAGVPSIKHVRENGDGAKIYENCYGVIYDRCTFHHQVKHP